MPRTYIPSARCRRSDDAVLRFLRVPRSRWELACISGVDIRTLDKRMGKWKKDKLIEVSDETDAEGRPRYVRMKEES